MPNPAAQAPAAQRELAHSIPLDDIDVSQPELYARGLAYPYFERLRREAPVHHCSRSAYGPYWSVTKFNDIVAIDTNHQVFSSDLSHGGVVLEQAVLNPVDGGVSLPNFIAMDPPKHDAHRMAVSPIVAPQNLVRLEGTIRERTRRVLDELPLGETFNWVQRVSIELTTLMLATLFDFPLEQRRRLTRWSDVVTAAPGTGVVESWEARGRELLECGACFRGLWEERLRQPPKPDLISMLAHSPATQSMSPEEFLGTVILLIVGGNDTTRNSMTASALAHHLHPGEFAKVKADRALVPNMVAEIIRWHSPVLSMCRTALQDIEFRGRQICQGDRVVMWYISGNRDEEVIERPDEFIVDRPRARHHLAFGFGIHRCLGNRLAELQLRILWEEILERYSRIEVMGEPVRVPSNIIHGFLELPVRLHA